MGCTLPVSGLSEVVSSKYYGVWLDRYGVVNALGARYSCAGKGRHYSMYLH